MPDGLTTRVRAWRERGSSEDFRDYAIHTFRQEGEGPLLLLLHGFPSSSYDWVPLLELLGERNLLAFDFLGFGLSDKPRDSDYSLFWQADLTEELVRRHGEGRPVFVLAHDMGTSVANELMARDLEGKLEMELAGILLFNGSMVLEAASPTPAQKALRSRLGPLVALLSSERFFRHQFGSVFSAAHPLSEEEAADQWSLVCHNGGRALGHRLVSYMDQRETHAERWHGAIRDWPGTLSLAWGMQDPVATTAVLAALRELRPGVAVSELAELAHYPQIEDPRAIARALDSV
ncbi:MAG TPA: alpha/beta fold hydrolase [Solirubrobacterales bacterium]|nr:alpha/beta fold hydrolase [Solirubrobacterales bacterium]